MKYITLPIKGYGGRGLGEKKTNRNAGLVIENSRVRIPAGVAGEFSSPSQLSVLTLYTKCYLSST